MDKRKIQEVLHESSELVFENFAMIRLTESPIEALFATAFWSRYDWSKVSEIGLYASINKLIEAAEIGAPTIVWQPQMEVAGSRVDFIFCQAMSGTEQPVVIAVECDGHDFHEKTKQQAARDKSRDRKLAAHGIRVLRFTGSEIYRDAGACAGEVFGLLNGEWVESVHRVYVSKTEKAE